MYTKTLGTESAFLITRLANQGQSVFSIADAQEVSDKSYSAVIQELRRLVDAGWVVKLNPGIYALVPLSAGSDAIPEANRFVIARALMKTAPYYLSHDSAFELHNMLTRPVTTVTITSPRRLRNRTVLKVPYRFIYTKNESLWGVAPIWVTPSEQVQVSDMERTILDGLSRPELCAGISEVATGLWMRKDDLDWEKLILYAQKLGNNAVVKRLGYLLELYGLGLSHIVQLQAMIGTSYALLDPMLASEGAYLARWRLRINVDTETLKGIVTT
ncbi:MAG: type IV toxin-antitoxin system AbiEi family antitoxin domain-containing protein [Chloroflexota bacterium]|nr:type IV toxin-antitoxin system AbiEi family antitoxin domain-containing protein [Chloroflexota bacterium]